MHGAQHTPFRVRHYGKVAAVSGAQRGDTMGAAIRVGGVGAGGAAVSIGVPYRREIIFQD